MTLRCVTGDAMTAQDVYDIWKIRDAVFAVEQQVDEEEVDGLDLLPTMTHLWLADAAGPTSYLRVHLGEDGLRHIGRVCTRKDQRSKGLSGLLMAEVSRLWGDRELQLNAQSYLERWYESFGYVRVGDDYYEAGILHTPMSRPPRR